MGSLELFLMRKIKLLFIGLTFLLSLTSCTSDYYYDTPIPQIMIGRWVNEDYTSPYKVIKLYRNGTYNIFYKSSVFTSTLSGRWYFIDRYLYFDGDMRNKLYVYSLEYPHIFFSNGSIWRKLRVEGC